MDNKSKLNSGVKVFKTIETAEAGGRRGSGKFAQIREELKKILIEKGSACRAYEVVKYVTDKLDLKAVQTGYNYTRNAVKGSSGMFEMVKKDDVNFIVRRS